MNFKQFYNSPKLLLLKKKVTRNEICLQNYNKFTTDSKQIKILILNNFALRQNYYFK